MVVVGFCSAFVLCSDYHSVDTTLRNTKVPEDLNELLHQRLIELYTSTPCHIRCPAQTQRTADSSIQSNCVVVWILRKSVICLQQQRTRDVKDVLCQYAVFLCRLWNFRDSLFSLVFVRFSQSERRGFVVKLLQIFTQSCLIQQYYL